MWLRIEQTRLLTATIALVLILSAVVGLVVTSSLDWTDTEARESPTGNEATAVRTLVFVARAPILIDGNLGFTNASGVVWGSGTESDPYVIENWDINASSADGIRIWNTDAHFIVRDCYVHDGGLSYHGINLYNCANGTVGRNSCSNNLWGIYLYLSDNNTLSDNNCSSNTDVGIRLYSSARNTLSNNTCLNNLVGIVLFYPSNSTVNNNNCSSNTDYGMYIQSSDNTTLDHNTCSSNAGYGMYIGFARNTTLRNSTCSSNSEYGIMLSSTKTVTVSDCTISNNAQQGFYIYGGADSADNRIWNNTFYHNNGAGDVYDPVHLQAYDDGTNNRWNSTDGYGNYWSDWTTPDVAPPDGIVDLPYTISGTAGAQDNYPLTTTPTEPIPEFSMMPLVVIALMVVTVFARETRRKKSQ